MQETEMLMSGLGAAFWLIALALYLYFSFCQVKMAEKLGYTDIAWWSWVPVLNIALFIKMAGKPMWWFVLCLIPIVSIFAVVILSMEVAKKLGKSPIWGLLMIVPVVNFASWGVMAFSGDSDSQYERVPAGSAPSSHKASYEREHI